jgi:hypothetical protein
LADWALAMYRRINRPLAAQRPGLMAFLALALVVAAIISWQRLGLSLEGVGWLLLLGAAALVPVSVLLTALEYALIARANGIRVSIRDALGVTVLGSVANLLPLPGAAMVRLNDLTARYGTVKGAVGVTAAAGFLWLGWALAFAGLAAVVAGSIVVGAVFAVTGAILGLTSRWLVSGVTIDGRRGWIRRGSAIEVGSLVVGTARIWLTLVALGVPATIVQAGMLVASGAIASTVGIVPGGLGIRELIAGLLAPVVELAPVAAILAVTVARVTGLVVQAPIALAISRARES